MFKKLKGKSELILAIIAVILIAIVFLRPPTDYDGGPMLAYNLLFFLPMTLVAGLLSLIATIIAIRKLILKKGNNKAIKIISLCLSLPPLIYTFSIFSYFIFPQDYEYPEYDLIPDPAYNSCDSIEINPEKTMHLVGYNWGKKLKQRRLYITLTPYQCDTFTVVETYCCQGDSLMTIHFQRESDSLFVYVPEECNVYTHHGSKYLDKIPAKTIKINSYDLDSLILTNKMNEIKEYKWN